MKVMYASSQIHHSVHRGASRRSRYPPTASTHPSRPIITTYMIIHTTRRADSAQKNNSSIAGVYLPPPPLRPPSVSMYAVAASGRPPPRRFHHVAQDSFHGTANPTNIASFELELWFPSYVTVLHPFASPPPPVQRCSWPIRDGKRPPPFPIPEELFAWPA
jgi:hypothetical protein